MSEQYLLDVLSRAIEQDDEEKLMEVCDYIASTESVATPVLFTLLAYYSRTVVSEWDTVHERPSNASWVRALAKHWTLLLQGLREVELSNGNSASGHYYASPLTSSAYRRILTGFSSLSIPEAKEGFLMLVGDDGFLDRLGRVDGLLVTELMEWLNRTDLPHLDDAAEFILERTYRRGHRALLREVDGVIIQSVAGAIGRYLAIHPQPLLMQGLRMVVIDGLRRDLHFGQDTLRRLFTDEHSEKVKGVVAAVKEIVGNPGYSHPLRELTVDMLELFLEEADPLSTC